MAPQSKSAVGVRGAIHCTSHGHGDLLKLIGRVISGTLIFIFFTGIVISVNNAVEKAKRAAAEASRDSWELCIRVVHELLSDNVTIKFPHWQADSTTVTASHLAWLIGADWRRDGLLAPDKPNQPWITGTYEEEQMQLFSQSATSLASCLCSWCCKHKWEAEDQNKLVECFVSMLQIQLSSRIMRGRTYKLRMWLKSESCHLFYTLSWTTASSGPTPFTQWHMRPTGGRQTAAVHSVQLLNSCDGTQTSELRYKQVL